MSDSGALEARMQAELMEEELEMELDDERYAHLIDGIDHPNATEPLDRRVYFRELLRRRGELFHPRG